MSCIDSLVVLSEIDYRIIVLKRYQGERMLQSNYLFWMIWIWAHMDMIGN